MEITTHTQPVQSSTGKESAPIIRVSGEYQELKLKSKNAILSVSEQALLNAIEKANRAAQGTEHSFQLKIHDSTHQLIVQIMDKHKEVIHEIPSEKFIDLVEKLKELSVGAIIDEKR
ncbi:MULTISPECIES: flagellar protein FlaG [Paenibacillus]|uniref:Flagellar protein FlaG n=1 Tax=Paenibacillus barengoltzii G22 TaxID=1235795 RepID=R9LED8_9BACL|nr:MULTISPECIES: flagellar protein FlaG [Paenibacillus]EOS54112.1 flagellar protein FlaG [Paenibacillus barengoltzii G22]MDU0331707.1 flagellar protein FlaG [Paenibacillus sp. 3LSP]